MDASGQLGLHSNTPGYVPLQNDGSPHPSVPPQLPPYSSQQPGYPSQPGYPPQPGNSPQHQTGYPGPPGFVNPAGYPNPGGDNVPGNEGKQPLMDNLPPNVGFIPPPGGVLFINGFDPVDVPLAPTGPHGPPAGGYAPPPGAAPSGGAYAPMYGAGLDLEAGEVKGFDFSEKSIRLAFIRKVYAVLMTQLLVTFSFVTFCLLHTPTNRFFRSNPEIIHFAWLGTFVIAICMVCCNDLRRKAPYNYICLSIYTVGMSILLGSFSSMFQSFEVLTAIGITVAICLSLTLFAFQTKYDFTAWGGVLLAFLVALILFSIMVAIFPSRALIMLYAALGAMLFAFYLIYDTQVIMGGKHKYSTSPEEYIFAALNLYLDVVNLFMYILLILSGSRK